MAGEDRYTIDLDWAWGPENPNLDGVATLRATVSNPRAHVAERQIDAWFATFDLGEGDARWKGGWAVEVRSRAATEVVVDLVSGGQDAADSLGYAVDELQDAVLAEGTTIAWEPQPIRHDED